MNNTLLAIVAAMEENGEEAGNTVFTHLLKPVTEIYFTYIT
jgi:hypothetical protein